jgi:hypothetical protein
MPLTLTITDNADGTGGVATVSGASGTVTVYKSTVTGGKPGSFASAGSRSGNGTVNVTGTGNYLWYAGQTAEVSTVVYQALTSTDSTTPVIERIADKLVARLAECTVANGYSVTVSEAIRAKRNASDSPLDYQVVVSQGEIERLEDMDRAATIPQIAYSAQFNVTGVLMPSDATNTDFDQLANIFAADLQRAICTPGDSWHNWDGLAFNSTLGNWSTRLESDGSPSGVDIALTVFYRVDESDPRTARP